MANITGAVGKRSQEESQKTQARILDTAEQLFARYGFGSVSMREIARATGVHHHTIQHHYGSKDELYELVLNRWDADLEKVLAGAVTDQSSFEEMIVLVVDKLFEFMLDKRDWVTLTARAAIGTTLCKVRSALSKKRRRLRAAWRMRCSFSTTAMRPRRRCPSPR